MNSALLRKILSLKAFAIAVGVLIMLYGLSLATDFRLEELVSMAKWSIGIALLHDMVWLPVTVAVGKLWRVFRAGCVRQSRLVPDSPSRSPSCSCRLYSATEGGPTIHPCSRATTRRDG